MQGATAGVSTSGLIDNCVDSKKAWRTSFCVLWKARDISIGGRFASLSSLEFDVNVQQILKQHLTRVFVDTIQIVLNASLRTAAQLTPKIPAELLNVVERVLLLKVAHDSVDPACQAGLSPTGEPGSGLGWKVVAEMIMFRVFMGMARHSF